MTLIFTESVDGWIGGDADVAALFDSEGVCRRVETASFYNEQTGWYAGLMLVYANSSSLNFQSNASLGSLASPIVISAVGDPTVGCTDAAATGEDGSCTYCCFQTGTTEVGGASGFGLAVEEFATAMIDGLTRTA